MSLHILLLGKNGQVGWELQRSLAPLAELVALDRHSASSELTLCGDLTNLQGLADTVRRVQPDVIVNAAATSFSAPARSICRPRWQLRQNDTAPGARARAADRSRRPMGGTHRC